MPAAPRDRSLAAAAVAARAGAALRRSRVLVLCAVLVLVLARVPGAAASLGDRLYAFRECLEVCRAENCAPGRPPTPIALHLRLLGWDCAGECDQACQRLVTAARVAAGEAVVQFHGKWPFRRLAGVQEPASVVFSLGNLWAHASGLRRLRRRVLAARVGPGGEPYALLWWYTLFGWVGMASWVLSAVFHTRDSVVTERLDYFGAAASVFYGLCYTPVRVFRLDRPRHAGARRAWVAVCALLYAAHVGFLTLVRWDYTYNMAANVACGVVQNALWTWFSVRAWRRTHRAWTVWPGIAVAWITLAMSLELFDFPPWGGVVDAHALWHLGTIAPTVLWYNFLIKDSLADIAGKERAKD